MPKRKRTFPCGHRGFGQFCHQCAKQEQGRRLKRQQKDEWKQTFAADPIDLTKLPRNIVEKSREIIQALAEGRDYREFTGKRLQHDRNIVSIPVTRSYRMVCRVSNGTVTPARVETHEEYNSRKPRS